MDSNGEQERTPGGGEGHLPIPPPGTSSGDDAPPVSGRNGLPVVVPHPGSRLAARLQALFEVLACSGFPTQLFIAQLLGLAGLRPFTSGHHYSTTFIVTLSLADAVLLVGLVLFFLHARGERPRDVLFGWRPVSREAILGILLTPMAFLIAVFALAVIQLFAPFLHNVQQNPLEALMRTRATVLLFALVAVVSGGIREEVQRAFVLHRFEQHLGGAPLGLLLFSLVFGAGHVIQGWDVALTTAALGAFWGVVYLARRSIFASMISHAGFDLAQILRYAIYGS